MAFRALTARRLFHQERYPAAVLWKSTSGRYHYYNNDFLMSEIGRATTRRSGARRQKNFVLFAGVGNNNKNDENFEREFQQKQKILSNQLRREETTTTSTTTTTTKEEEEEEEHVEHQTKVFDEMATFFASEEAIPPDVVPILEEMTNNMISTMMEQRIQGEQEATLRPARANSTSDDGVYRILDVGCGTGALFDFYIKAAEANNITIQIHGIDLSANMLQKAKEHGEEILSNSDSHHSITVEQGDICHYSYNNNNNNNTNYIPGGYFDLVVANACFGNFWDQTQSLKSMTDCLRLDGLLCITHPLGSAFVQKLHEEDPKSVPHLLPTTLAQFQKLSRTLQLQVLDIVDKKKKEDTIVSYYRASARKVVYRTLSQTIRLRGEVDSGYGRGGKKLGFPTANLPSRLFQNALENVDCGVYFGWAVLEGTTSGRNIPHKAVVNVGYSPTFEGQENPEKIVEAHLILLKDDDDDDDKSPLDPPDFYGEVMRLQLIGFIRPEMKFPSFPALIAQITTDVQDAKDALDLTLYKDFQKDPFVSNVNVDVNGEWIGGGGGNDKASWEFEHVEDVLGRLS